MLATAADAAAAAPPAPPSLLTQVGMAGTAAVLTVTVIHPIDVIKVRERRAIEPQNVVSLRGYILESQGSRQGFQVYSLQHHSRCDKQRRRAL